VKKTEAADISIHNYMLLESPAFWQKYYFIYWRWQACTNAFSS